MGRDRKIKPEFRKNALQQLTVRTSVNMKRVTPPHHVVRRSLCKPYQGNDDTHRKQGHKNHISHELSKTHRHELLISTAASSEQTNKESHLVVPDKKTIPDSEFMFRLSVNSPSSHEKSSISSSNPCESSRTSIKNVGVASTSENIRPGMKTTTRKHIDDSCINKGNKFQDKVETLTNTHSKIRENTLKSVAGDKSHELDHDYIMKIRKKIKNRRSTLNTLNRKFEKKIVTSPLNSTNCSEGQVLDTNKSVEQKKIRDRRSTIHISDIKSSNSTEDIFLEETFVSLAYETGFKKEHISSEKKTTDYENNKTLTKTSRRKCLNFNNTEVSPPKKKKEAKPSNTSVNSTHVLDLEQYLSYLEGTVKIKSEPEDTQEGYTQFSTTDCERKKKCSPSRHASQCTEEKSRKVPLQFSTPDCEPKKSVSQENLSKVSSQFSTPDCEPKKRCNRSRSVSQCTEEESKVPLQFSTPDCEPKKRCSRSRSVSQCTEEKSSKVPSQVSTPDCEPKKKCTIEKSSEVPLKFSTPNCEPKNRCSRSRSVSQCTEEKSSKDPSQVSTPDCEPKERCSRSRSVSQCTEEKSSKVPSQFSTSACKPKKRCSRSRSVFQCTKEKSSKVPSICTEKVMETDQKNINNNNVTAVTDETDNIDEPLIKMDVADCTEDSPYMSFGDILEKLKNKEFPISETAKEDIIDFVTPITTSKTGWSTPMLIDLDDNANLETPVKSSTNKIDFGNQSYIPQKIRSRRVSSVENDNQSILKNGRRCIQNIITEAEEKKNVLGQNKSDSRMLKNRRMSLGNIAVESIDLNKTNNEKTEIPGKLKKRRMTSLETTGSEACKKFNFQFSKSITEEISKKIVEKKKSTEQNEVPEKIPRLETNTSKPWDIGIRTNKVDRRSVELMKGEQKEKKQSLPVFIPLALIDIDKTFPSCVDVDKNVVSLQFDVDEDSCHSSVDTVTLTPEKKIITVKDCNSNSSDSCHSSVTVIISPEKLRNSSCSESCIDTNIASTQIVLSHISPTETKNIKDKSVSSITPIKNFACRKSITEDRNHKMKQILGKNCMSKTLKEAAEYIKADFFLVLNDYSRYMKMVEEIPSMEVESRATELKLITDFYNKSSVTHLYNVYMKLKAVTVTHFDIKLFVHYLTNGIKSNYKELKYINEGFVHRFLVYKLLTKLRSEFEPVTDEKCLCFHLLYSKMDMNEDDIKECKPQNVSSSSFKSSTEKLVSIGVDNPNPGFIPSVLPVLNNISQKLPSEVRRTSKTSFHITVKESTSNARRTSRDMPLLVDENQNIDSQSRPQQILPKQSERQQILQKTSEPLQISPNQSRAQRILPKTPESQQIPFSQTKLQHVTPNKSESLRMPPYKSKLQQKPPKKSERHQIPSNQSEFQQKPQKSERQQIPQERSELQQKPPKKSEQKILQKMSEPLQIPPNQSNLHQMQHNQSELKQLPKQSEQQQILSNQRQPQQMVPKQSQLQQILSNHSQPLFIQSQAPHLVSSQSQSQQIHTIHGQPLVHSQPQQTLPNQSQPLLNQSQPQQMLINQLQSQQVVPNHSQPRKILSLQSQTQEILSNQTQPQHMLPNLPQVDKNSANLSQDLQGNELPIQTRVQSQKISTVNQFTQEQKIPTIINQFTETPKQSIKCRSQRVVSLQQSEVPDITKNTRGHNNSRKVEKVNLRKDKNQLLLELHALNMQANNIKHKENGPNKAAEYQNRYLNFIADKLPKNISLANDFKKDNTFNDDRNHSNVQQNQASNMNHGGSLIRTKPLHVDANSSNELIQAAQYAWDSCKPGTVRVANPNQKMSQMNSRLNYPNQVDYSIPIRQAYNQGSSNQVNDRQSGSSIHQVTSPAVISYVYNANLSFIETSNTSSISKTPSSRVATHKEGTLIPTSVYENVPLLQRNFDSGSIQRSKSTSNLLSNGVLCYDAATSKQKNNIPTVEPTNGTNTYNIKAPIITCKSITDLTSIERNNNSSQHQNGNISTVDMTNKDTAYNNQVHRNMPKIGLPNETSTKISTPPAPVVPAKSNANIPAQSRSRQVVAQDSMPTRQNKNINILRRGEGAVQVQYPNNNMHRMQTSDGVWAQYRSGSCTPRRDTWNDDNAAHSYGNIQATEKHQFHDDGPVNRSEVPNNPYRYYPHPVSNMQDMVNRNCHQPQPPYRSLHHNQYYHQMYLRNRPNPHVEPYYNHYYDQTYCDARYPNYYDYYSHPGRAGMVNENNNISNPTVTENVLQRIDISLTQTSVPGNKPVPQKPPHYYSPAEATRFMSSGRLPPIQPTTSHQYNQQHQRPLSNCLSQLKENASHLRKLQSNQNNNHSPSMEMQRMYMNNETSLEHQPTASSNANSIMQHTTLGQNAFLPANTRAQDFSVQSQHNLNNLTQDRATVLSHTNSLTLANSRQNIYPTLNLQMRELTMSNHLNNFRETQRLKAEYEVLLAELRLIGTSATMEAQNMNTQYQIYPNVPQQQQRTLMDGQQERIPMDGQQHRTRIDGQQQRITIDGQQQQGRTISTLGHHLFLPTVRATLPEELTQFAPLLITTEAQDICQNNFIIASQEQETTTLHGHQTALEQLHLKTVNTTNSMLKQNSHLPVTTEVQTMNIQNQNNENVLQEPGEYEHLPILEDSPSSNSSSNEMSSQNSPLVEIQNQNTSQNDISIDENPNMQNFNIVPQDQVTNITHDCNEITYDAIKTENIVNTDNDEQSKTENNKNELTDIESEAQSRPEDTGREFTNIEREEQSRTENNESAFSNSEGEEESRTKNNESEFTDIEVKDQSKSEGHERKYIDMEVWHDRVKFLKQVSVNKQNERVLNAAITKQRMMSPLRTMSRDSGYVSPPCISELSKELSNVSGTGLCDRCFSPASFLCSGCNSVNYCSEACQKSAWTSHIKSCSYQQLRN